MALERATEPAGAEAGLWQDPSWTPDTPGTFAVVIGVSAYHHLVGGDGSKAKETFGLGQLHVSALTAWNVFSWLRDEYAFPGAPVAKVWLLLTPGPAEIAHDSALATAAPAATWAACQRAIKAWYRILTRELTTAAAAESRALFSFCGHGFEVTGNQILLPDDYMNPNDVENPDYAISTRNLVRALASAPVPTQLFFPDACRNDTDALLRYDVMGTKILPEAPRSAANAARVAPVLNATASGSTAWQPSDPATGLSLYGEALLEALRGTGDITVDWSIDPSDIRMYPIQDYLNRRIPALFMEKYNQQVLQPVRVGGEADNAIVTKLHRQTAGAAPVTPTPEPDAAFTIPDETAGGGPPLPDLPTFAATPAAAPPGGPDRSDDMETALVEAVTAPFPISSDDISGSETMAAMWGDARLYSLRERAWVPWESLHVHDVRRDEGGTAYRIAFELADAEGDHWLELSDGERTFACLLPGDPAGAPRYALDLARQYRDDGPPLVTEFLPTLALGNPGVTGTAVRVWESLRRGLPVKPEAIERGFDRAEPGSLAATVLLLAALRGRMCRSRRAPEWVELVMAGRSASPDNAILADEVAMVRGEAEEVPTTMPTGVMSLMADGLPRFAEAFELALGHLDDLVAFGSLSGREQIGVERILAWMRVSSRTFRAGGLLTTFAGPPEMVTPELVLPPRMA